MVFVATPVGVPEARTTSISQEVTVPLGFVQFKEALFEVIVEAVNAVGVKHGASMLTSSISHRSPPRFPSGCVYTFTKET